METLYQGSKDVFLAKVRADFDAIEQQALKSTAAIKQYSLVGTDPLADALYTEISDVTDDGSRAVWRHVGVTGIKNLGTRQAGSTFSDVEFIRTYETAVFDPDNQPNGKFKVPYEREAKEARMYKSILSRAQFLMLEIDRMNVQDPFEVFNLAFTAPSSYPTTGLGGGRFFARGNMGLDGNNTALGERLISTQHARADAGTAWSNAINSSGNAAAFSDTTYWAAKLQGASLVDDRGKPYPAFGGSVTIVTAPNNVRAAKELQESDWVVDLAENQININKGTFNKIISTPYLNASAYVSGVANTGQWFLVDESMKDPEVGTGLVCLTFIPLQSNVYNDESVSSAVYTINQEKVYGFVNPRIVLGSNGSGSPYSS
jgi:hypothetical protein